MNNSINIKVSNLPDSIYENIKRAFIEKVNKAGIDIGPGNTSLLKLDVDIDFTKLTIEEKAALMPVCAGAMALETNRIIKKVRNN